MNQREYDRLKPIIAEVEAFKKKNAELKHKIEVIEQLKANQYGPVRVMDEVSKALPDLLWLTNMSLAGERAHASGAGAERERGRQLHLQPRGEPVLRRAELEDHVAGRSGRLHLRPVLHIHVDPAGGGARRFRRAELGGLCDMAGLDLENRPWYFALIIGVVIAGVPHLGLRELLLQRHPEGHQGAHQRARRCCRSKVREGKAAEARLPQFREEAERLETELHRLLRILPTAKQTDELIKKIKSLTERGNFRFVTFQPQGFVKKDFYSEWPIKVQLEATYHELALFFDRLSQVLADHQRRVADGPVPCSKRGSPTRSASSFTMKTFIYGDIDSRKEHRDEQGSVGARSSAGGPGCVRAGAAESDSGADREPDRHLDRRAHPARRGGRGGRRRASPTTRPAGVTRSARFSRGRPRRSWASGRPGLRGMGIEEIKLQGILRLPEGYVAMVQGTDNLSYLIRPGTVLYDGTVELIEQGKVVFKMQVADPKSLKPYREVVRTLQ